MACAQGDGKDVMAAAAAGTGGAGAWGGGQPVQVGVLKSAFTQQHWESTFLPWQEPKWRSRPTWVVKILVVGGAQAVSARGLLAPPSHTPISLAKSPYHLPVNSHNGYSGLLGNLYLTGRRSVLPLPDSARSRICPGEVVLNPPLLGQAVQAPVHAHHRLRIHRRALRAVRGQGRE
jgi:hypothetical protein